MTGIKPDRAFVSLEEKGNIHNQDFFVIGLSCLIKGDSKKAIENFEKEIYHTNNEVFYWLGKVYKSEGNLKQAKKAWLEGIKINPNDRFIKNELKQM